MASPTDAVAGRAVPTLVVRFRPDSKETSHVMEAALALAGHAPDLQQESGVVEARDLSRRYGAGETAVDALRGVSLSIPRGHLTAVMGPSGSGKSTLMHILAGLDTPTSGSVSIDGIELTTLKDNDLTKLRRRHIGFVFQFFNLLPMLSAEENVLLPLSIAGEKPEPAWLAELLDATGLTDRRSHRPSELSGGQQQRVAVARALVSKPTVLFADEPTGNLDSQTSAEILGLLRGAVDTYGQTTVMVTHDPRAATIADRVLFLADGVVVNELGRSSQAEILDALSAVHGSMRRVALRGLARPQAPLGPDGDRNRARRRDGQRHARPHRHDRQGVRLDLLELVRADRRGRLGQEARRVVADRQGPDLRGRARAGARAARGRGRGRHDPRPLRRHEPGEDPRQRRQGDPGQQPDLRARRRARRTSASTRSSSSRATGPPAPARS